MAWLAQNWLFIVFTVGVIFLMSRGGGCGGHHHKHGNAGRGPAVGHGNGHSSIRMRLGRTLKDEGCIYIFQLS